MELVGSLDGPSSTRSSLERSGSAGSRAAAASAAALAAVPMSRMPAARATARDAPENTSSPYRLFRVGIFFPAARAFSAFFLSIFSLSIFSSLRQV